MAFRKHHALYYVGGYLVVAFVYNRYLATAGGFTLPFDVLGSVI